MLERAHIELTVRETEHARHAIDIGKEIQVGEYDVVVTISGDGLVHELINGLMQNESW